MTQQQGECIASLCFYENKTNSEVVMNGKSKKSKQY